MAELFAPKPAPVQVTVYVCAAAPWSITVVEPEVATEPDQAPLAVQDVAFALDQVTVAFWPGVTALGLMDMDAVALGGGGVGVTEEEPPLLQPERTKADRRQRKTTGQRGLPVRAGTCISPPIFMNFVTVHVGLKRSNTE